MDKLKAASLTSSLLAAKGAATPAIFGAPGETLVYLPQLAPRRAAPKNGSARPRGESANGRARGTRSAADANKAARGRNGVNVSFRLDPDRHLRLKILAAHHHGSMRECLEAAVELYLANNGPAVRGGGCACVADRGVPNK